MVSKIFLTKKYKNVNRSCLEPKIASNTSRQEVKEFNDLMTWMDNEFWEQADE